MLNWMDIAACAGAARGAVEGFEGGGNWRDVRVQTYPDPDEDGIACRDLFQGV